MAIGSQCTYITIEGDAYAYVRVGVLMSLT